MLIEKEICTHIHTLPTYQKVVLDFSFFNFYYFFCSYIKYIVKKYFFKFTLNLTKKMKKNMSELSERESSNIIRIRIRRRKF